MPLFILTPNAALTIKPPTDLTLNKRLENWRRVLTNYSYRHFKGLFTCQLLSSIYHNMRPIKQPHIVRYLKVFTTTNLRANWSSILILGSDLGCPQVFHLAAVSDFQAKRWFKVSHINSNALEQTHKILIHTHMDTILWSGHNMLKWWSGFCFCIAGLWCTDTLLEKWKTSIVHWVVFSHIKITFKTKR